MFLVLALNVRNPKRSQARVFLQLFRRRERYFVNQFSIGPSRRRTKRDEIQEVGTAKDVEPFFVDKRVDDSYLSNRDLILLDIKSSDPDTYRNLTGQALAPTLRFAETARSDGQARLGAV